MKNIINYIIILLKKDCDCYSTILQENFTEILKYNHQDNGEMIKRLNEFLLNDKDLKSKIT